MLKAAVVCLLAASAAAAPAKAPKTLKLKKNMRSIKSDHARVLKHLNTLLAKAPDMHKADLKAEAARLSATSSSYTDVASYFAYPMTLDWIVDLYFEDSDDATAYPVILDSGSANLAVAIASCTNCGDAATTLAPTVVDDMCIEVTYGSGEWSGVEVESSYVSLGGALGGEATYAGITYQDEFFEGGSSYVGILGMAYEGIANSYADDCDESATLATKSSRAGGQNKAATEFSKASSSTTTTAATPLLYTLYDNGAVDTASFAVAMCDDDAATVSLGGLDDSLVAGTMTYASTQKTFGEYYGYFLVYTSGVSVGATSVTVANVNLYGGLVVDTGTTLHYLPTATVKAIEAAVTAAVDDATVTTTSFYNWEACVTSEDLASFPDVTYTFAKSDADDAETFDVVLQPAHYLLDYGSCYYWGFEASTLGIFGNIGMKNKVVDFDVTNNVIGFGTGVCSTASSSSSKGFFKSPSQLVGEVAASVGHRSSSELAVGFVSALAVVGTVLASAFVVLNKAVARRSACGVQVEDTAEAQALLPPL